MRFIVIAFVLALTGCGHKTKLIRPADIPEYERKRQEKIDKYAPYDPTKQAQTPAP